MKYKRISTSVLFDGPIFNEEGKVELSQSMRNKIYEKEEGFREKLILDINNLAQGKWHIDFTEYPSGNFEADVYVESKSDFDFIKSILISRFRENPLEYIWKKTFRDELFKVK
ncbi:hypothetical protein [Flagellimonas abyssi]|uniref:Uncharacterized protein n=1 Tax=Flagellimonas abyssi TaxID=2864871 RepID=A0ABS7EWL7_9FLAO|nr:hypothetical protein [Allomuricauda abyssi]MBW8202022.1 hypothetical protein [Allomuricauda abyssi]